MSVGTIVFLCPACGYKARIPTQYAGHTIRCPGCQSPQVAQPAAPSASTGKTISIMKVASTPVPFTLPPDQAAALAAASTTPLPMELGIQAVGVSPGIPVLGNPSGLRPRIATPLPDSTPRANVAQPAASKPIAGATIDFTCTVCHGRMRIPAQYVGKSILCPKCSAPQKVTDSKLPAQPMDTTRSLKSGEPTQTPPLPSPRIARPPSGEIVPQTAPQYIPPALDAAPTQVHKTESDSALARAGVPRRRGVGESGSGIHTAPPMSAPIPPPPRAVEPSEESSVIPSDNVAAEPAKNGAKVVRSGRKPSASASSSSDSAATVPVTPRAKSSSSSSSLLPVLAIGLLLVAALGGCGWLWMQLSAAEARTAEVEQAKSKAQAKAAADLAAVEARLTALEQQLKEAHAAVEAVEAAAATAAAAASAAAAAALETPASVVVPEPTPTSTETPAPTPAP